VQKIKFWEHLQRLEDIKIFKKITNWNTTRLQFGKLQDYKLEHYKITILNTTRLQIGTLQDYKL